MDPMNNPTDNPMPAAPAVPVASTPEPVVAPEPVSVEPGPAPTGSVAPAAPVNPVVAPGNPAPVNPVVMPGNPAPVNPVFQPKGGLGVAATDPIMMPEQPKAPDPIEEELKAPMKAAGPVPGSIGSAVSGPSDGMPIESATGLGAIEQRPTPNVAFTDPASQPESVQPNSKLKPAKKGSNKTTLIALIIVAVMIVIGLAGVLIWQLMGNA